MSGGVEFRAQTRGVGGAWWRLRNKPDRSREPVFDDVAADVGQPEVSTLKAVGELEVIESEGMQHRRVQVVDVHGFFGNSPADVIAGAVNHPPLEAATGQEHAERERMVVAACDVGASPAVFSQGSAAKFSAPHDHGLVE